MTSPNPGFSDPSGRFTIGNTMGRASSSGMMRLVLFLGTNLAIVTLVTVVSSLFGIDPTGVVGLAVFSLLIGMGGAFVSLLMSKWVAKRSTRAQVIENPANEAEQWLLSTVGRLAAQAGIGMPEVAIFPSAAPNAFATGAKRDDSLVAVSAGLLRSMNRSEVEAVLAHEIAHVANGDMITLTLIQGVLNSLVIFVSRMIAGMFRDNRLIYFASVMVLQIGFGFLASMIVMWFSRRREFRADAGGAALVGPAAMAGALARLEQASAAGGGLPSELAAFGIRESKGEGVLQRLLSSHPSIPERIAALQG